MDGMYDPAKVGKIIAEYRNQREWSQRQLLQELERHGFRCSDGYVGRVETGASKASPRFLITAEKVFRLEAGELLCYAVLEHTEKFCQKTRLDLDRFTTLLRLARKKLT